MTLEPFSRSTLERLAASARPGSSAIGQLYARMAGMVRAFPPEQVFVGSADMQWRLRTLAGADDVLVDVIDQDSALEALARLAGEMGEIRHTDVEEAANGGALLDAVRTEHDATVAAAVQSGAIFAPARKVAHNPSMGDPKLAPDATLIADQRTREVAHAFNDAYDTLLFMVNMVMNASLPQGSSLDQVVRAIRTLMASVLRPLGEALTQMPIDSTAHPGLGARAPFGDSGDLPELPPQVAVAMALLDERLWRLATQVTALGLNPGVPLEVLEATAALQDLACQFASADGPLTSAARLAALRQLQVAEESTLQVARNGPYLVTNVDTLHNWLGERIETRPRMALCRCGGSASKPFCDGTHARLEFTGSKEPKRVSDRRDTYHGEQITILDNRGVCAHSGFCTDRLATVFRVNEDPFVAPSGDRMDEIIRAVRACPSGALSYAIDGREAREQVDSDRAAVIEVSKDGPYRITGAIQLMDEQGHDAPRNTGASREHYSLCRCGHSQNKPFCSGMHWYVNFRDPVIALDHEATLFEWAGGLPALRRMTHIFYEKYVPQEPLLSPLFANMSPDHPERVAAWLGEVFGGPKNYSERYGGYVRMLSQHSGKGITEAQRARWAALICQSAEDAGLPADADFRAAFVAYVEWGSRLAVENSTPGAHPPPQMPMPRWWWVCDATPWGRVSALASKSNEGEETSMLPGADEPVRFDPHVKSLFRARDRQSMQFAFDLWSYDDVTKHADAILARVRAGTMPCDGPWPQERVDVFQRWVDAGMPQ
jgi:CDGSH-type Zn-finger protein/truncated hemoglobin YjbI